MAQALTVDVGWPWWAITAIAAGVSLGCAVPLALRRTRPPRAVAALVLVEGVAVAVVAPFVMPDMSARGATPPMASVPSPATELIHVIEHEPASNVQQVGNVQVFADHVFDGSNRKRIGQDHGFCVHVVVPNQPKTWECMYTTELPGGWITIEGTSTDAGMPPSAIIGGTGKYANARGYMLFRVHNKAATEFDEFFHVTR